MIQCYIWDGILKPKTIFKATLKISSPYSRICGHRKKMLKRFMLSKCTQISEMNQYMDVNGTSSKILSAEARKMQMSQIVTNSSIKFYPYNQEIGNFGTHTMDVIINGSMVTPCKAVVRCQVTWSKKCISLFHLYLYCCIILFLIIMFECECCDPCSTYNNFHNI